MISMRDGAFVDETRLSGVHHRAAGGWKLAMPVSGQVLARFDRCA
jgi:hypothetical protein